MDNEEIKIFGQALSRAMFYCSRAEHCPADVFDKLSQWDVPRSWWDEIVAKLAQDNFLSEERYTRAYIVDKIRYNKWGKRKVAYQLRAKNIPTQSIDRALSEINDEDYLAIIQHELEKKCKTTKELVPYKLKAKLVNFATSRGYESDLFIPIIDNLLAE